MLLIYQRPFGVVVWVPDTIAGLHIAARIAVQLRSRRRDYSRAVRRL